MNADFSTPEWVKTAIFYQIFPDRFARSDSDQKPNNLEPWDSPPTISGFKGGDLVGIMEKLDYLEELGINAVYFNPIFQSASNHRYHTHDYFQVDPLLGNHEIFKSLLTEAHRRGIKIILDGVFNHASRGFYQFNHLLECGSASPYIDWFLSDSFPLNAYQGKPNYVCWAGLPALPKFNTNNQEVKDYLFDVARYWLDIGIDGWRLDVPGDITDPDFWCDFRKLVKGVNPEAYLVGEIPWQAEEWLQGNKFDGVMNYQFTQACLAFFGGQDIDPYLSANLMGLPQTHIWNGNQFAARVTDLVSIYPEEAVYAQLNLLSSHDMPRFLSLISNRVQNFRLAILFQMTYPGAPCVYYGDEIGMVNGPSRNPEDARYAFSWDQASWNYQIHDFVQQCIQLRRKNSALTTGDFKIIFADDNKFTYARRTKTQTLVIVINNSDTLNKVDVDLNPHFPPQTRLKDLLTGNSINLHGGILHEFRLDPKSGVILDIA
jgi:neopullulanase